MENRETPLPVRTTAMEIVDLRNRLNHLIDELSVNSEKEGLDDSKT